MVFNLLYCTYLFKCLSLHFPESSSRKWLHLIYPAIFCICSGFRINTDLFIEMNEE